MQKPIVPLATTNHTNHPTNDHTNGHGHRWFDDEVMEWQQHNLRSALATSLLLLQPPPPSSSNTNTTTNNTNTNIPLTTLFQTIAGLSYTGDPRVTAGAEDPHKLSKLVRSDGQLERFVGLYRGELEGLERLGLLSWKVAEENSSSLGGGGGCFASNLRDKATRNALYERIPPILQSTLRPSSSSTNTTTNNKSNNSSNDLHIQASIQSLTHGISQIVGPPARIQSVKGVITAGVYRSLVYAGAKFAKGALRGVL